MDINIAHTRKQVIVIQMIQKSYIKSQADPSPQCSCSPNTNQTEQKYHQYNRMTGHVLQEVKRERRVILDH